MAVHAGEPLKIQASVWNDVLAIVRWWRGSQIERLTRDLESIFPPSVIWIKNTTSSDIARGEVLAIDSSPVITLSENADFFKSRLEWEGTTPSTSTPHFGKFVVLREPAAKNGGFARAVASGVALAKLNITHASDNYCEIANGVTSYLTTSALGSARILWKSTGTGSSDKWGLIRLGDPSGEILVYNATGSSIAAGASGTATVYSGTPLSETSTTQTLTVYNRTSVAWANAKFGSAALLSGYGPYVSPQQT